MKDDVLLLRPAHEVLGLTPDSTAEEMRQAYLTLIKKFPPERDAERFHEIHNAYQRFDDPLKYAEQMLDAEIAAPDWPGIVAHAESSPPRLSVKSLLSLGNDA
jgi:curved DNA-binding protein CbpA